MRSTYSRTTVTNGRVVLSIHLTVITIFIIFLYIFARIAIASAVSGRRKKYRRRKKLRKSPGKNTYRAERGSHRWENGSGIKEGNIRKKNSGGECCSGSTIRNLAEWNCNWNEPRGTDSGRPKMEIDRHAYHGFDSCFFALFGWCLKNIFFLLFCSLSYIRKMSVLF